MPRPARSARATPWRRSTFLGHATMVIEIAGIRLVTDPVLRRQVGPLYRRRARRPSSGRWPTSTSSSSRIFTSTTTTRRRCGCFDAPCPSSARRGARRSLGWRGFHRHPRVGARREPASGRPGDRRDRGAAPGHPSPARAAHAEQWLRDQRQPQDIYFAGDTGLFAGMADLWDGLDVALLPIAGLGPWMPEFKHLSPRHAVRAARVSAAQAGDPHPLGHVSPAGNGADAHAAGRPPAGAVGVHARGGGFGAGDPHRAARPGREPRSRAGAPVAADTRRSA